MSKDQDDRVARREREILAQEAERERRIAERERQILDEQRRKGGKR